jgi:hypothetical protein
MYVHMTHYSPYPCIACLTDDGVSAIVKAQMVRTFLLRAESATDPEWPMLVGFLVSSMLLGEREVRTQAWRGPRGSWADEVVSAMSDDVRKVWRAALRHVLTLVPQATPAWPPATASAILAEAHRMLD